jgi:hypothetical protein
MDTSLGQEKPEAQIAKQPAIKVQTTLVMVPAIVTNRSGSHVEDLKEEDFQVSRNGKTQKPGICGRGEGCEGPADGSVLETVEGHLAAAMIENIKTQGVRFPGSVELPSGEYTMIFAVRDNIRQLIGSVFVAIRVP